MAIDTRNRRASTLRHSQAAMPTFPNPDGAISSQADRQHVGMIYAGIAVSGGAATGRGRLMHGKLVGGILVSRHHA